MLDIPSRPTARVDARPPKQTSNFAANAGTNHPWMVGALDLDGRRRVQDGAPDIGCYEYLPAGMMFSIH